MCATVHEKLWVQEDSVAKPWTIQTYIKIVQVAHSNETITAANVLLKYGK
jgi:hypothetical protein